MFDDAAAPDEQWGWRWWWWY